MKPNAVDLQREHATAPADGRGADLHDLLSLRDRIGTLTTEQSAHADAELEARRAAEAALARDLALAAAIDAEAQSLELENHRRGVRLLAIDAAAGVASFLATSMIRDASGRPR